MAAKVFVSIRHEVNGVFALHWAVFNSPDAPAAAGVCADAAELGLILAQNSINDAQLIGVIPAAQVLSTQVDIPARQARHVLQALPFAIEEQVTQDIDSLHLVLGPKTTNTSYSVLAVPHSLMNTYADLAAQTGLALSGIFVDAQLLPAQVDSDAIKLAIFIENDWFTLVRSSGSFFQSRTANLPFLFDTLFLPESDAQNKENDTSGLGAIKIACFVKDDQKARNELLLAQLAQEPGVDLSLRPCDSGVFMLACNGWFSRPKSALNLCQGSYRSLVVQKSPLKRWYALAAVILAGLLLQVSVNIGQGLYYKKLAQSEQQRALATYKTIFPNSRNVTVGNLGSVIKGKLLEFQSQGGKVAFLDLLGQTAEQYRKQPGATTILFRNLQFSEQRGELVIDLNTDTFEQLDMFKNALAAAGLGVKISSAVKEPGAFRGRLHVGGS